jgi:hypothetical protein
MFWFNSILTHIEEKKGFVGSLHMFLAEQGLGVVASSSRPGSLARALTGSRCRPPVAAYFCLSAVEKPALFSHIFPQRKETNNENPTYNHSSTIGRLDANLQL